MDAAGAPAMDAAGAPASSYPDEIWAHIFSFLCPHDRNSAAAACRSFLRIDRQSRRHVFIPNCYSISPTAAVRRFPAARAVVLKGKPHFADFNLLPVDWGARVDDWIVAMAMGWPMLEELRLKRMMVSDGCLEVISGAFQGLRVLALNSCDGFSTMGLASIAAGCRNLRELDLYECEVEDKCRNWLSQFPESFTSLTSLNFPCLSGEVNDSVLERLISRCPNFRSLKLNHDLSLDRFARLLSRAPQLEDLGTSQIRAEYDPELFSKLSSTFARYKQLTGLSGIWEAVPAYLPALYSACEGVTSLNLSYANIQSSEHIKLVGRCKNLQKLWVMDLIEDSGLAVVASSCKLLRELRVFPSDIFGDAPVSLTERGLIAVSAGCPMLQSVLYFCRRMTNVALMAVARNRPNLTRFRLCIMDPHTPDYLTRQPLDAGFIAIVESCKNLQRLSLSGLLTDRVFKSIGASAKCLEMLSVAFAGDSDASLHYLLSGCENLRKLEIRDCPFGDKSLLNNAGKLETMRSLWMSSCSVTLGACKRLARLLPQLSVEIIDESGGLLDNRPDDWIVEKLYLYRTLAGRRHDSPPFVWIL